MNVEILMNLLLCVAIVIFAFTSYEKSKKVILFYITLAFSIFGLSHLLNLTGLGVQFSLAITIMRFIAYGIVFWAVFTASKKNK